MADTGSVRLSVPGKVILMGEHAAVYGRPAVVAAVDLRLEVEASLGERIRPLGRGRVTLDLPDIGVLEESTWQEVEEFTDDARRRWRAYKAGSEPFRSDREEASLVRIAVGEAVASLTPAAAVRLREQSLDLRLRSAIPVGAGLGSSAAAAVGVVAAVRAASSGADPTEQELATIENVALEVERRQHGFPSGIDTGTVVRGGVVLVRLTGGAQRFDDLPRPDWLRLEIGIVDSGAPDQTTGAVVTTVRRRYEEDPERVGAVLDRIAEAVESFRVAVVTDQPPVAVTAVAAAHRALVDLGVVPPAVAQRIAHVEAAGGVAKISGAGALDGESAGALVCMLGGRDARTVEGLSDLVAVDAPIGGDGLRFED